MTDNIRPTAPEPAPGHDTVHDGGALLLAAGGFAAAFGAAACCALPVLLGALGLGGTWLAAVAWVAAPHRILLLAIAVVCLASGGGVLFWRRGRMVACPPGAACGRPAFTTLVTGVLSLGVILVALGFLYA